jgi:hypothetical protein
VGPKRAPAEHPQVLLGGQLLDRGGGVVGGGLVGRQEGDPGRVGPGRGQLEVDDRAEELVRDLDQDARAVPGVLLRAAGAAVFQAQQCGDGLAHDGVVTTTGEIGHHRDATGVVLEIRGVEAFRGNRSVGRQQCLLSSRCTPTRGIGTTLWWRAG